MSTSSYSPRDTCRPDHRTGWRRLAAIAVVLSFLLVTAACGGAPEEVDDSTVISYAGAADRLSGMEQPDAEDQLRDWAWLGLAAELELDTPQVRDAFYDNAPIRDPAFTDLAEQPTGPGRALFDGRETLHLLVPQDDPHKARTIGLLLDDHRTDTGTDPPQTQIHHYQIHPEARTIELVAQEPAPTAEVRSANGYVESRVDDTEGLAGFLAQASHLSTLEIRDSEVWAGGWNWPELTGGRLSAEDVSVIQRGYLTGTEEEYPGFSLDPRQPETIGDVVTLLPQLSPDLVTRIFETDDWSGSPFASAGEVAEAVDYGLFAEDADLGLLAELGLPADRTQLYLLSQVFDGAPLYSQARYEGGLAGTEVGMTLFYTDYVTKNWIIGRGTGVPTGAVAGFVPDPDAEIPWSHCPEEDDPAHESGRLWFGPDETGFTFGDTQVGIGAQATRLFVRSDGEDGTEVEPSYSFGRGLHWWDRHYQQVADYEPQYQRLDQIIRWSGALEWLVSTTGHQLPQLDDSEIRTGLRFQDWYAQHNDLRERAPLEFVTPPSASEEAILNIPTPTYEQCGLTWVQGGVSLSNLLSRTPGESWRADLPAPVRRAGPVDPVSSFNPQTGSGKITRLAFDEAGGIADRRTHTFSAAPDGSARVSTVGDGRRVAQYGDLKVWRAGTAQRAIETRLLAGSGYVSQRVSMQGQDIGELVVRKEATTVTVQWHRGPLDRIRHGLSTLQARLTSGSGDRAPVVRDGVLYAYHDPAGGTVYKVAGRDGRWFSITNDRRAPADELVFQVGGRNPGTGLPEFYHATFAGPPTLQHAGRPAEWMEVVPRTLDRPAVIAGTDSPRSDAGSLRVTTPDGKITGVVHEGPQYPRVRVDDPLFGIGGMPVGTALLRDSPRVIDAMRDAARAQDGLFRVVVLDADGVAFAGPRQLIVAPADHPWTAQALRSFDPRRPSRMPLVRVEGSRLVHVDGTGLRTGPPSEPMRLREVPTHTTMDMYVHRSMLQFEDGAVVRDGIPWRQKVIVSVAEPVSGDHAHGPFWRPDSRVHRDGEFFRLPGTGTGTGTGTGPGPGASAGPIPPAPGSGANGQFVLVCPADDPDVPGCAEEE